MKFGHLNSIRWEPFPKMATLSTVQAANPMLRALMATGVPSPPQSMTPHDDAAFFLNCAAEIEHSLLVQYLYAAYSIDLSNPTAAAWQEPVLQIAREEMGHLISVQNLLLAIGEEPYFDRQFMTTDPFPFQLERLSETSLAKYVTTESPALESIPDQTLRDEVAGIEAIADMAIQNPCFQIGSGPKPAISIQHVGLLYARLYWLFLPTDTIQGPWTNLPATPFPAGHHLQPPDGSSPRDFPGLHDPRQAEPVDDDWGLGGLISPSDPIFVRPISSADPKDAAGACQTLFDIAAQGEGPEDTANSHFRRFLTIFREVKALPAGALPISLPVACSPSVDPSRPGRTITNSVSKLWAELFNVRYQMVILKIWYAMSQPRGTADPTKPAARPQLISQAVNLEMTTALGPIGRKLSGLPLKPRVMSDGTPPTENAGPPFELPDAALPTDPANQRQELIRLIDLSAAKILALRNLIPGTDPDHPTMKDDKNILSPLADGDQALRKAL